MNFWKKFLGFDPNRSRSFPGQQPGEEVVLMTVFHWMKLVPFFFYLLIAIVGYLSFYYFFDVSNELPPESRLYLNTIFAALVIHFMCFRLYNFFLKVLVITNYRLIEIRHSVFLLREREVIPMANIQDLRFHQRGILPRIFKYGDLIVFGASTDVKYHFHYIIKVNKMHHLLNEIRHKASTHNLPQIGVDVGNSPRTIRELSPSG